VLRIGEKLSRRRAPGELFGDKEDGRFAISTRSGDGVGGVGMTRESVWLVGGGVKDPDGGFNDRGPLGTSRLVAGEVGSDIPCSILFAI